MSKISLKFQSVNKSFGNVRALKDFSLEIEQGEKVAILGCNGAGKTTFLSLASGMRVEDSGTVKILGGRPTDIEIKKRVSVLPQVLDFPKTLKVREVLNLVAKHFGTAATPSAIQTLDLQKLLQRRTSEMSGGERRKLGLACALIGDASLLFLDEPTANVDLLGRSQIYDLIKDFLSQDKTLVFSTHQVQEVERLADRVVVLKDGQVYADGSAKEIKEKFGVKKIRFRTKLESLRFKEATKVVREENQVLLFGNNSDNMLRELIENHPDARDIQIFEPDLAEVFLKISNESSPSQ